MKTLTRRRFFAGATGALTLAAMRRVRADSAPGGDDLDVRDVSLEGDPALGQRMTLAVPRHLRSGERAPLLVLLHGLGETGDGRTGAWAWIERYGLASAYARLRHPPVVKTAKRGDLTDERLRVVNDELKAAPFEGFVVACPFTPNVNRMKSPATALDGYAKWIADVVVPRARKDAPVLEGASMVALDGCSLGGFVALEVFLRRPEAFGAIGVVQAAIGKQRVEGYTERMAAVVAGRAVHVETSTGDPFREANEALGVALRKRGVKGETLVLPGPHDQPWLREAGTLEMLRWHDKRFRGARQGRMGEPHG